MKKTGTAILNLVLSVMMIMIGEGVVVTHCAHSGQMTMGFENKMDGMGCHKKAPCMTITVVQLAPTLQASTQHIDFHNTLCSLPANFQPLGELLPTHSCHDNKTFTRFPWHSPPRWYLTLLTLLQI